MGTLNVDGNNVSSGYKVVKNIGDNISLGVTDQQDGNYQRTWNQSGIYDSKWEKRLFNTNTYTPVSPYRNTSYPVVYNDNGAVIRGSLRKICNVNFQNNYGSLSDGTITINGSTYNSPTANFPTIEENQITASAVDRTYQSVLFTFSNWTGNGVSVSNSRTATFTPTMHVAYAAKFTGKPLNTYRNLHDVGAVGQAIRLAWNEHPHPDVTSYQIWRKVKHNGLMGAEALLATVNRGTTTYTDYDYSKTSSYTDDLLYYDVRPYFSPSSTYADPGFLAIFGETMIKEQHNNIADQSVIKDYFVGNYPNPFNPTTTINYQLPKAGFTSLKIYDMLGKVVGTLVSEYKEQGNYNVEFNANNLASGTYIYELRVNDFVSVKKMMLVR